MTDKEHDFIGKENKEPDDPPFRIDTNKRKVFINVKSTYLNNLYKMMKDTVKIKDKKQEKAMLEAGTFGLMSVFFMDYCKTLDRTGSAQRVVTKKFFNLNKDILTYVLKTIPERKEKSKVVAKDRYEYRGGRMLTQRAAHNRYKREDPEGYFHWECPLCEPTEHFNADVYKTRQGQWNSLMLAIKKHPKLRDYLKKECDCEIEDYNIQKLYPTYRNSSFCKVKSRTTKSPKTGQSVSKHVIENMKIKLKDEGHALPNPTVDDEKVLVYIHQYRLASSQPEICNSKDIERKGFEEVARMQGNIPSNWKAYRNAVKNYCEDNGSDYDNIVRPRERRKPGDDHSHD